MRRLIHKLAAVIGGWSGWLAELPVWLRVMQWLLVLGILVAVVRAIVGLFRKGR